MLLRRVFTWLFGESDQSADDARAGSGDSTAGFEDPTTGSSAEICRNAQAVADAAAGVEDAIREATEALAAAAETVREVRALEYLPRTPVDELVDLDAVDAAPRRGPMKRAKSDAHPRDEWFRNERRSKVRKNKNSRAGTELRLRRRRDARRELARR